MTGTNVLMLRQDDMDKCSCAAPGMTGTFVPAGAGAMSGGSERQDGADAVAEIPGVLDDHFLHSVFQCVECIVELRDHSCRNTAFPFQPAVVFRRDSRYYTVVIILVVQYPILFETVYKRDFRTILRLPA